MIRTTAARIVSLVLLGSLALPGAGFVVAVEDTDADAVAVRAPEPSALEREDASKSIRRVFRSEYSKKGADDRRQLGQALLAEAKKGNSADATRFELLSESRTIAAKAADLETALGAIDRLDSLFNIDRLAITEETLASFPRPRSLVGVIGLHKAWQGLIDHAISSEDYPAATRIAATAHKLIRKTRDKVLTREAKEREEFTESLEREYEKVSPSLQRLLDNPEDAAAQEKVAVFLCLHKREWTGGLAVAVKNPSTPLGAVAQRDLENPRIAAAQVAVGIEWQELADGYKNVPRISCLQRAVRWFDSALVSLGQITRSDVEKRLAAIYK